MAEGPFPLPEAHPIEIPLHNHDPTKKSFIPFTVYPQKSTQPNPQKNTSSSRGCKKPTSALFLAMPDKPKSAILAVPLLDPQGAPVSPGFHAGLLTLPSQSLNSSDPEKLAKPNFGKWSDPKKKTPFFRGV